MPLRIRIATSDDAPQCLRIYSPYCGESPVTFETVAPTEGEWAERVAKVLTRLPWLVAHDGERVLGYVYASPHRERAAYRWCVEVAAYVDPAARGRGVGRALYAALHGVLSAQGYVNAYAAIALPNAPSVALHESAGYRHFATFEGIGFKAGRWVDVAWYVRGLRERGLPPAEPLAFPDLVSAGAVEAHLVRAAQGMGTL